METRLRVDVKTPNESERGYTYSTSKQKKIDLILFNIVFRHILQPIERTFALRRLRVACGILADYLPFYEEPCVISLFLAFPCCSPVVGSKGPVLTAGVSRSDEWQRGTASGPQHKNSASAKKKKWRGAIRKRNEEHVDEGAEHKGQAPKVKTCAGQSLSDCVTLFDRE